MGPTQTYPLNYPVFEADQVLTNDDLNQLFDYLDCQQRLTRTRLIGMGILCGLELSGDPSGAGIHISRGCGVTSWGYLVLQEAITLGYYRSYGVPTTVPTEDQYAPFTLGTGKATLYELLSEQEFNKLNDSSAVTALSDAPQGFVDDKVVVLYLELTEDNLKNCLTGDCDQKGIDVAITLKRLLISTADLSESAGGVATPPIGSPDGLPDLFMPRITLTSAAAADARGLYEAYGAIFDTSVTPNIIDLVADALQKTYLLVSPLLDAYPVSPFTQVKSILLKRLMDLKKNVPYAIQYYYDFIDDLLKAYDELKDRIREVIGACCPDDNKFPLHLLLGLPTLATTPQAAYRQYFLYAPRDSGEQGVVAEIRQLFARIKVMIDNFFVPSPISPSTNTNLRVILSTRRNSLKVKITPSRIGTTPLSRRAIPYYYQIDDSNPIHKSWNYQKTRGGKANQNLSYNADRYNTLPGGQPFVTPLAYSIEPYNFFRIEGHIGQHYLSVLKYIRTQQNTYRLPFDVVAVKLGSDWADITPDVTCMFSDLETQYDLLKSELYCKLGDQICYYATQRYLSDIPILLGNVGLLRDLSTLSLEKTAPQAKATAAGSVATSAAVGGAAADAGPEIQTSLADFNLASLQLASTGLTHQDVLKYASLLPVNLRPVFLVNAYAKGQFLSSRPCFAAVQQPPAGTTNVGLAYLARIKQGAIPAYPPNDIRLVSDYMLKMTDLIEGVISTVFYSALGSFNAEDFTTNYQALTSYAASLGDLVRRNATAKNIPAGLAEKLSAIEGCCQREKLQALKQEYQSRLQNLRQALLFNNYITKNPGIDHKAGVPKGGTFVLVYYEKPAAPVRSASQDTGAGAILKNAVNDPGTLKSALAGITAHTPEAAAVSITPRPVSATLYQNLAGIVQDKRYGFTPEQQQAILKVVTQRTPAATLATASRVELPDKGVIADFYLPYLCCSDCGGGTTYVFPPEPPTTEDPSISMQPTTFCTDDTKQYAIAVEPAGGAVTGDGVTKSADGSFVFVPGGLSAGSHTLSYQSGDKVATLAVTVTQAPAQPDFGFQAQSTAAGATVIFQPSGVEAGLKYHWDFGDGTSADTLTPPAHNYGFEGAAATLTVTFTLNSGPCSVSVSKQLNLKKAEQPPVFAITPARFSYNDPGSYPFSIFPPVTQADIVSETTDPNQLSNPDSLLLKVSGNKLSLVPSMPQLPATLVTTLRYQQIPVTITIIRPVARFTIGVKTTSRAATTFRAVAPTAAATIAFTALDTAADAYSWTINGKALTELVAGTVSGPSPVVNAALLVRALGQTSEWVIGLAISYTVNQVVATDEMKGTVTLDQLTKAVNKDPFEPKYG